MKLPLLMFIFHDIIIEKFLAVSRLPSFFYRRQSQKNHRTPTNMEKCLNMLQDKSRRSSRQRKATLRNIPNSFSPALSGQLKSPLLSIINQPNKPSASKTTIKIDLLLPIKIFLAMEKSTGAFLQFDIELARKTMLEAHAHLLKQKQKF
ncbi:unnamed protein product [Adineta ricciae]|uniref:Uncharacterized protein n=1 Tax=Adineta ricciae TaxID=249248 RepID=A0A814E438_ADIRI|nr:unnamed protein product [Adineta ricciae]